MWQVELSSPIDMKAKALPLGALADAEDADFRDGASAARGADSVIPPSESPPVDVVAHPPSREPGGQRALPAESEALIAVLRHSQRAGFCRTVVSALMNNAPERPCANRNMLS